MFPLVKLYSLLRGTRFLTWFDVPKLLVYIYIIFIYYYYYVIVPMFPLVTQSEKGRGFTLARWNEVKPSFPSLPRTPYVKRVGTGNIPYKSST